MGCTGNNDLYGLLKLVREYKRKLIEFVPTLQKCSIYCDIFKYIKEKNSSTTTFTHYRLFCEDNTGKTS